MAGRIVSYVPDILVEMRIDSAARALGAQLVSIGDIAHLEQALAVGAAVLIVDLGVGGLDVKGIVAAARSGRVPVIGFGPHVEQEMLRAAEEAGMDAVYPRSAFIKGMGRILRERLEAAG